MTSSILKTRTALLGQKLIIDRLLTVDQLDQALECQKQTGAFIGELLVTLGFVPAGVIGEYLQSITGFPFVTLADVAVALEMTHLIPEAFARRKGVLPFRDTTDAVHVALVDPLDIALVDELRARLSRKIVAYLALESDIRDAIDRVYDSKHQAQSVLDEIVEAPGAGRDLTVDELVGLAEDAPIVRLVNGIVKDAIAGGTSDIHIEPHEHSVRVRFRQDGLLYDHMTVPSHHLAAVVSRIKIMSHLNISERRRPQDGRCVFRSETEEYDLRVNVLPVIYGEKVVMRLLKKSSSYSSTDRLGFFPEQQEVFERLIQRPHGILLVTGPTGSGKSTTLYAALNKLNDSVRNINTVEDPVEYQMPGANQIQVMPQIGFNFAACLRALMRQDPDVIMVGEIRDRETAETAVQAALTGHLVLSTLHTNNAAGALVRLQNMGVEPFLISSAVLGVVGQRLLRTICLHCKISSPASEVVLEALGVTLTAYKKDYTLASGAGCAKCGGRGMKGRTAVYEIMPMSSTLREMALHQKSGTHFHDQAVAEGMLSLREAGLRKALDGVTTIEEVARVLFSEEV